MPALLDAAPRPPMGTGKAAGPEGFRMAYHRGQGFLVEPVVHDRSVLIRTHIPGHHCCDSVDGRCRQGIPQHTSSDVPEEDVPGLQNCLLPCLTAAPWSTGETRLVSAQGGWYLHRRGASNVSVTLCHQISQFGGRVHPT